MNSEPIRVIFILGTIGRGGAEKQLISLLDNLDPTRIDARLLVMSREAGEYWEEHIRSSPAIQDYIMPQTNCQEQVAYNERRRSELLLDNLDRVEESTKAFFKGVLDYDVDSECDSDYYESDAENE